MRPWRRLFLPEGLVVLAALVVAFVPPLARAAAGHAPTALFVTVAVGVLLSLRFHRGRALLMLLLLVAADQVLALAAAAAPADRAAFTLVATLLPLNFTCLALLPERGAATPAGALRLAVLAAQGALASLVVAQGPTAVVAALETPLLPVLDTTWTPLPQPALALGLLALVLFLAIWAREGSQLARGLVWTQAAILIGLLTWGSRAPIWFAAAGLALTLAVIESSYALAYHDGLTGLPSRRALGEALHALGDRYVVAMVDVDHFKQCNDRWGHDVGDQVLRLVAARLEEVGGGGRAYRYGGEEFAVVFDGAAADDVVVHLEALRAAVEASAFTIRHRPRPARKPGRKRGRATQEQVSVTISIGAAEGRAATTSAQVVKAADAALYRAKEGGRNRIVTG